MNKNMRALVRTGYNEGEYDRAYVRNSGTPEIFERVLCDELLKRVNAQPRILDLGCGVGLPYDKYFIKRNCNVVGVDISEKHIEKAQKNVPKAEFILGDFFNKAIKGKFDAIVSFYAIFHIPRTEHKTLFTHIHS
ncbi:MAG: class I SAM-dependent methyltransferase [Candidatus Woesearchaeota archaeon]